MNQPTEISDGAVRLWIEQEAIHLKAVDPQNAKGDPVELTKHDAIRLAEELLRLAKELK